MQRRTRKQTFKRRRRRTREKDQNCQCNNRTGNRYKSERRKEMMGLIGMDRGMEEWNGLRNRWRRERKTQEVVKTQK